MATVIQSVPIVDRINREARDIHVGRLLLTIVAAILFAIGWTVGKTITVLAAATAWSVAAVKVGYRDARGTG